MYKSKASRYYKGNSQLPKAGTLKEITPEQLVEMQRCITDPVYFAENYFKIVSQEHGVIPLKLYPYQREAVEKFVETNRLLMATARQIGKTTIATVLILWVALFNDHKYIALLADKESTAIEILSRIQLAYELLPEFLKGGVKEWNKKSVEFENGSKITASATGSKSIRGKSIYFLYIDECAHVEDWEDFASAVMPTVSASKSSKIVLTSTPNGMNHFYDYYEAAKKGVSDYPLVEIPWWKVEGRDEAWRLKTLADLNNDEQKFAQEQEVEFLGSSGTLISGAVLKLLQADIKEPVFDDQRGLKIYERPEKDHKYVLIADVSRGKGIDYHAFHVVDITKPPYKQVCTFHNNEISATDYAAIIDQLGRHYNHAEVLVELNDNGGAVLDVLFLYHNYENLLMTEGGGPGGKKRISSGFGKSKVDRGVRTDLPTRSAGCSMLKMIVEQRQLLLVDKQTIKELETFSAKPRANNSAPLRYEAEAGKHDDLVLGLVLFAWLTNQDYFKQSVEQDILLNLRETPLDEMEDQYMLVGIMNGGSSQIFEEFEEDPHQVSSDQFDSWMIN